MALSLKLICFNKISQMIINSKPKDVNESDEIVKFINKLPTQIIQELEDIFFGHHFEYKFTAQLKYLTIYKIFLSKSCSRFWLNTQFKGNISYQNSGFPLSKAIQNRYLNVVELLLETVNHEDKSKRVKLRDNLGLNTALHMACHYGQWQIVERLLKTLNIEDEENRIEVNARTKFEETALHIACLRGHVKCVELLLRTLQNEDPNSRIDVNAKDFLSETAFFIACVCGHKDIVQLFLDSMQMQNDPNCRIDLNARNRLGETALHRACFFGKADMVKLLLGTLDNEDVNCRIDLNARNVRNEDCFDKVYHRGQHSIVRLLRAVGLPMDDDNF